MTLYRKVCHFCNVVKVCTIPILMTIVIVWGLWGWGMLTYWYLDDAPVISFGQGVISDTEVHPFQSVVVRQPLQKYRSCHGLSSRFLTGECGHHILSEVSTVYPLGFDGNIIYPFVIPDSVREGSCAFQMHVEYRCNIWDERLSRQVFDSPPISFTVKRLEPGAKP